MEQREVIKSKRIGQGGLPTDYANIMAWMKLLRQSPTRKVYEINPYIEVYQFRDNVYGLFTENCDFAGDVWMYLIIGPEKALLIDTAFGLGDIKGLVDFLSGGKPLIVVNTHPHPDHGFGNCRFDKVYCHEYAVPILEQQDEHLWDYLFDADGHNIWLEFDRQDLPAFKPYEICGVPDGTIFNLGEDYNVEMIWVPGHASSHCMFMDQRNRILFAGDGICSHISGEGSGRKQGDPYYKYNNIENYRREIQKLIERMNEIDSVFPSHFIVDLPADAILPAMKEACDAVLDESRGYDFADDYHTGNGDIIRRMYKNVKGFGILGYSEGGLWQPTE